MEVTEATGPSPVPEPQPGDSSTAAQYKLRLGIIFGAAVLMWLAAASTARFHWGGESYYNFGWAVPFLAAFLFYRRLGDLPAPESPTAGHQRLGIYAAIGIVLLYTPVRLVNEVNVIWRVPLVMQGLACLALSLVTLWIVGGKSWVRHLWFPCFFLLTMFPWPFRLESTLIQDLTRMVTAVDQIVLQFIGYPAQAAGNTIRVGDANIGIDDACSGVRSLQVLTMSALFLGEFLRFSLVRRIALIIVTLCSVFFFNMIRSLVLSVIVIEQGAKAYEAWHDKVGIYSFLANLVVVYLLSEGIGVGSREPKQTRSRVRATLPGVRSLFWPLAAVVVSVSFVEGWYRYHEIVDAHAPDWVFEWKSTPQERYEAQDISKIVLDQLGADYAKHGTFVLNSGQYVEAFVYGYDGHDKITAISSYVHSPMICMGAVGAKLDEELEPLMVQVGGNTLRFRHFIFAGSEGSVNLKDAQSRRRLLHVFWNVTERQNMGFDPQLLVESKINYKLIFEQTLKGRRDYARKVALLNISGVDNADQARDLMRGLLKRHLEVEGASSDAKTDQAQAQPTNLSLK